MFDPQAYIGLPEFDAPFIAYNAATNSYYLRYNDPPEFLDIPGYRGEWQNLDALERDRPIHILKTAGCNGQNLDYVPDWYPTAQQAIDFKESTDEEKAMLFGIKGSVPSTAKAFLPGDLILRDQRWFGTFSGNAGERFIEITIDESHPQNEFEISDKFISTFSSQAIDTSFVTAVYGTHIEVALLAYEPGYIAVIKNKSYTILAYDRGKLYLIGGTAGIVVGQTVQIYVERTYIPFNDNDFDAFQSGAIFRCTGFWSPVLDHFPNARSIVQSIQGDYMCDISGDTPHYKFMQDHPQGEEFYYSRFLPECWAACGLPTTKIYLRHPLSQDYSNEPFSIINKQWYVASVEAHNLPEEHEPECWEVLRIGGSDIPYRFRRCLFKNWNTDDLPGDITYSYGLVNPPMIQENWFEEHNGNLYNGFPNWYQSLEPRYFNYDGVRIDGIIPVGEWTSHGLVLECDEFHILFDRDINNSNIVEWKQWATLTRILTVPNRDFYESLGNFADMFVCNLEGDPHFRNLPKVTSEGLVWEPWSRQLYAARLVYVTGEADD